MKIFMKILIDMSLSPAWIDCFKEIGIQATHWSACGPPNAPDALIVEWAFRHAHIVFTHDLDFGAILHSTAATAPSVVQLRSEDVRPATMGKCVCSALLQLTEELQQGALVTIDPRKNRVALLPLRRT
ncbi:MAG: DUF5615 family PIN-like protein [Verrucomicrobia bacterium]|nr:DUF5615 family PIN-like protein [Verrucomicrobiota bacterium]